MLANRVRMSQIKKEGIPSYYVMAQDSDFSGTANGSFKYIGSHEYVIIPHVIKGVNVTSYKEMFYNNASTILKGVASDNLNVTNMESMFWGSQATTGYARTQADADRFNASSRPPGLTFVVK